MNDFSQHGLLHRLLMRMGWQFVEHQRQLTIYRNGEVSYVLEPGYHPPINRWRESYGDFVSTAIRMVQAEQISIRTNDRITVEIDVTAMYTFDATECASQEIMASMVCLSRRQMNKMVENIVCRAVQDVCGNYREAELAKGTNWPSISRKIRIRLQERVGIFGFIFRGKTAIAITRITPPALIDKARQIAHRNQIYAESITQMSHDVARDLNVQEIARHSSNVRFTYVEHRTQDEQQKPYSILNNRTRIFTPNSFSEEEVIA